MMTPEHLIGWVNRILDGTEHTANDVYRVLLTPESLREGKVIVGVYLRNDDGAIYADGYGLASKEYRLPVPWPGGEGGAV